MASPSMTTRPLYSSSGSLTSLRRPLGQYRRSASDGLKKPGVSSHLAADSNHSNKKWGFNHHCLHCPPSLLRVPLSYHVLVLVSWCIIDAIFFLIYKDLGSLMKIQVFYLMIMIFTILYFTYREINYHVFII